MASCTSCGYELDPVWKFCVHCGKPTGVRRNTMNVTAVVGLVLGCIGSPLAAVFGIAALVSLRRRPERGRVLAIIAVVLGVLWTGAAIVLLPLVFASQSALQ